MLSAAGPFDCYREYHAWMQGAFGRLNADAEAWQHEILMVTGEALSKDATTKAEGLQGVRPIHRSEASLDAATARIGLERSSQDGRLRGHTAKRKPLLGDLLGPAHGHSLALAVAAQFSLHPRADPVSVDPRSASNQNPTFGALAARVSFEARTRHKGGNSVQADASRQRRM